MSNPSNPSPVVLYESGEYSVTALADDSGWCGFWFAIDGQFRARLFNDRGHFYGLATHPRYGCPPAGVALLRKHAEAFLSDRREREVATSAAGR